MKRLELIYNFSFLFYCAVKKVGSTDHTNSLAALSRRQDQRIIQTPWLRCQEGRINGSSKLPGYAVNKVGSTDHTNSLAALSRRQDRRIIQTLWLRCQGGRIDGSSKLPGCAVKKVGSTLKINDTFFWGQGIQIQNLENQRLSRVITSDLPIN